MFSHSILDSPFLRAIFHTGLRFEPNLLVLVVPLLLSLSPAFSFQLLLLLFEQVENLFGLK